MNTIPACLAPRSAIPGPREDFSVACFEIRCGGAAERVNGSVAALAVEPEIGKIKGTLLVHLRGYAVRNHGEEDWRKVVRQLPEEDQEVLNQLLMVGAWYPVSAWNRALQTYLSTYYADPGRAMTSLAQYVAEQDLSTVYKLVLKLGSPEFILTRSSSLYNRYFEAGAWTAERLSDRRWHCTLKAPKSESVGPNRLSCTEGICAWNRRALELTGVRPTFEQIRCRFDGALACEYEAMW